MLLDIKKSFVLENGLLPKNPRYADNGDGCADSIIKCFLFVIKYFLLLASLPQRMKTTGVLLLLIIFITSSVNI